MARKSDYTFYSKSQGFQVSEAFKERKSGDYLVAEGRITVRFFDLQDGKKVLKFVLTPEEAHELGFEIGEIAAGRKKNFKLVHKFTPEGSSDEVTTTLTAEQYGTDKVGYAMLLSRGENKFNVPMLLRSFRFLGDLCRHIACVQAYTDSKKADAGAGAAA